MALVQNHRQHTFKLVMVSLSALAMFLFITWNVLTEGPLLRVDAWVSAAIPALHSDILTTIITVITDINGVKGSVIFSLFLLAYLYHKQYRSNIKFYLMAFLGSSALFSAIKLLVERARPVAKILDEQGYAFPSGHSTMAMAIALSLYFIFVSRVRSSAGRRLLLLAAIGWPLLIAFSRLYLNVHWFSDTMAGLSLGIFWVTLLASFFPQPLSKETV